MRGVSHQKIQPLDKWRSLPYDRYIKIEEEYVRNSPITAKVERIMQTQTPLKEIATEELRGLIEAIQEELDERKWDELLARPVVKGSHMWEIQERAKADIRAGRVKKCKSGETF